MKYFKKGDVKEMNLSFSTAGMTLDKRELSFQEGNIVPIGTVCFRAGDWLDNTKQIIVTEDNQKEVSMFWNSLYFMDENKANEKMNQARIEYNEWIISLYWHGCQSRSF